MTTYTIAADDFIRIYPLLEEYFGITLGDFMGEANMAGQVHLPNFEEFLETRPLNTPYLLDLIEEAGGVCISAESKLLLDGLGEVYNELGEECENDELLKDIMFLTSYMINKKYRALEWDGCYYNDIDIEKEDRRQYKRKDLLQLYKYAFGQTATANHRKTDLYIKDGSGKVDLHLKNVGNWLPVDLLQDYLPKCDLLAGINSIEDADKALKSYEEEEKEGRMKEPLVKVVVYGIYRLLNDYKKVSSPKSNSLCRYIYKYLLYMGIIEEDRYYDPYQSIRGCIKWQEGRKSPLKFHGAGEPVMTRRGL